MLYAHNGAKFDHHFIFKSTRRQFDEIIDSIGILHIVMKDGFVEFRDTMRMTGVVSLAKLCKDFKLPAEFSKTDFPHKFMTEYTVYHVGEVPESKFWIGKKSPK